MVLQEFVTPKNPSVVERWVFVGIKKVANEKKANRESYVNSKMTRQRLSRLTMHLHTVQCFNDRSGRHFLHILHHKAIIKNTRGKLQPFLSSLKGRRRGWMGRDGGRALLRMKRQIYVSCMHFSSWFSHTVGL